MKSNQSETDANPTRIPNETEVKTKGMWWGIEVRLKRDRKKWSQSETKMNRSGIDVKRSEVNVIVKVGSSVKWDWRRTMLWDRKRIITVSNHKERLMWIQESHPQSFFRLVLLMHVLNKKKKIFIHYYSRKKQQMCIIFLHFFFSSGWCGDSHPHPTQLSLAALVTLVTHLCNK